MTEEEHRKHDKETEEAIVRGVEKHGWFGLLFEAEANSPSFGYSIGFWQTYKHPEVIIFGLPPKTIGQIMHDAAYVVKQGGVLPPFVRYDQLFQNADAVLLPVSSEENMRKYFGYGLWYNKGFFPALQIVWGDRANRFPWEAGFEERFRPYQPLIGQMTSES